MINKIKTQSRWVMEYIKIVVNKGFKRGKRVFLVNTPTHGNLGDQAIVIAEKKYLKDVDQNMSIIEITSPVIKRHTKWFRPLIGSSDIYIQGGGSIGTLWMSEESVIRDLIRYYPNNRIVIFPQTIYFEDSEFGEKEKEISKQIYNGHNDLWICTREKKSYQIGKELFANAHIMLVPDMVPYLSYKFQERKRKGVLTCLRSDLEKSITEEEYSKIIFTLEKRFKLSEICHTDTVVERKISPEKRDKEVEMLLKKFASSRLIVTDRLHGMVFAAITGTPCIVLSNCNQKVKGVYQWIKNNKYIYYLDHIDQMDSVMEELLKMKSNHYDKSMVMTQYKPLKRLITSK